MMSRTMKVLTPLAAFAIALGAYASGIQKEGFEGYAAGDGITSGANKFLYVTNEADVVDASEVQGYTAAGVAAPTGTAKPPKFADSGDNFLKLSTEEGRLFRSINDLTNGGTALGSAVSVGDGLVVDTALQFTLTDVSDRPDVQTGDKFSLWLEVQTVGSEVVTNLMACGGVYTYNGGLSLLANANALYRFPALQNEIAAGSWHRVTVKAFANVNIGATPAVPGFQVLIDGEAYMAERVMREGEDGDLIFDAAGFNQHNNIAPLVSSEFVADSGEWGTIAYIPSLSSDATLQAVGFAGEGKVDDIAIYNNTDGGTEIHLVGAGLDKQSDGNGGYIITAPTGYTIGSLTVDGVIVAAAAGQTSWTLTASDLASSQYIVVAAKRDPLIGTTPWYMSPKASAVLTGIPQQDATSHFTTCFHGQGQEEFFGFGLSTGSTGVRLYNIDDLLTNNTEAVQNVTNSALAVNDQLRGVAISKALNVMLALNYNKDSCLVSIPLDEEFAYGANSFSVIPSNGYAFDAAGFSPDGRYLFSNTNPGTANERETLCKWRVNVAGLKGGDGDGLVLVGQTASLGGRVRNMTYARIANKDIAFAMLDGATAIKAVDMTSDTVSEWAVYDLAISNLPTRSYGSLCVSATGTATPHLTVATSNVEAKDDVLAVYEISVGANSITATEVAKFNQAQMTMSGFGSLTYRKPTTNDDYGNTVYVTEDESMIVFGRGNGSVYIGKYCVSTNVALDANGGEGTMDAVIVFNPGDGVAPSCTFTRVGYEFTGWNTQANGEGTPYAPDATIAYATAPETLYAQWSAVTYSITYLDVDGTAFASWSGSAPAATYTVADNVTLPGASDMTLGFGATFNGWTNEVGEAVESWTAGQKTGDVVAIANISALTGPTQVEPGSVTDGYADQAAAEAATNNMVIVACEDVSTNLVAEQLAAYRGNFEYVIKQVGEGNWAVEVALTDSATNSLTQQANADVATVAGKLVDVAAWSTGDEDVTVSVAATPGFYYSVAAGATLGDIAEVAGPGERVLAKGETVTLTLPKQSTAGFYKVLINIEQKTVTP
ncbi:MAG: InlB B-repeat-containing protein [Kiritimatiellae bacterium]|nr:InlB B-repeat-containing protein [Kiritimatiellia bacterium]